MMKLSLVKPSIQARRISVRSTSTEVETPVAAPAVASTPEAPVTAPVVKMFEGQSLPTDGVTLQMIMSPKSSAPEAVNGRVAMIAMPFCLIGAVFGGHSFIEQAMTGPGLAGAVALICFTVAGSFAPAMMGVTASKCFPDVNATYPDEPLPYFWTPLAEKINSRAAMFGFAAEIAREIATHAY